MSIRNLHIKLKLRVGRMERGVHSNPNPNSLTLRDRNSSFSSYPRHDHHPNKSEPHLDHDSTNELGIFNNAHKYFDQVSNNNDLLQKVTTINNNNRVSPLFNMDTPHKHIPKAKRDDITNTNRSYSYSSPGAYKAHSFHASTPTPSSSSSSSKASWNNQVGLLSHPQTNAISLSTRNLPHYPHSSCNDLTKRIITSLSKPICLLRKKCPCADKKSVQVNEIAPKPKTPITTTTSSTTPQTLSHNQISRDSEMLTTDHHSQRFQFQPSSMNHHHQVGRPISEGFNFPLFVTTSSQLNVVREEEDTPRDSLQVFQPTRVMDDDAASDASSDLFEIESFSLPMKPTITECHDFYFAGDTVWWRRQRDTEVPQPPLPRI